MARDTFEAAAVSKVLEGTVAEEPALGSNGSDWAVAATFEKERSVALKTWVTIGDLEHGLCRWPIDDPEATEPLYCGARSAGRSSYCELHSRVAYQRNPP